MPCAFLGEDVTEEVGFRSSIGENVVYPSSSRNNGSVFVVVTQFFMGDCLSHAAIFLVRDLERDMVCGAEFI